MAFTCFHSKYFYEKNYSRQHYNFTKIIVIMVPNTICLECKGDTKQMELKQNLYSWSLD